jgi:type I restriction enzyme, S subunit
LSFFKNPNGYPNVPLIEVASLQRGYDLPIQNRVNGSVPIYAANGQNGNHNQAKATGPGVVTGRSGTIGKVHYVEGDYWPLNTSLYVTDFHGNHPKWVYYMLQAFKLERFVEGAGVPTLNRNLVHGELIPLPPLAEQKRIAAILDKSDSLRRKNQQAIQLADKFLRAVFLDLFGDPVTNPKGWEKRSLENVCAEVIDCPHTTPKWSDTGFTCLRTSNLTKGDWNWDDKRFVSEETYKERTKRAELKAKDIILSREGTVGIAALVPENEKICMGQRLVQLRVNSDILYPEYMLFLLLYELEPERISKVMAGSTSKHLNVRDLRKLEIAIPPLKKQQAFSNVFLNIKNKGKQNILGTYYGDELFNALSQKAFAGKL